MDKYYLELFNKKPDNLEDDKYYFNSDLDGDCFDCEDVKIWWDNSFYNNIHSKKFLQNKISRKIIETLVKNGKPTVELACGPGMGLIPSIKQIAPQHICMATDASSLVINEWKRYMLEKEMIDHLDFAQFSLMDIPFKDNSVLAYSSYIGISSTRNGDKGYNKALSEIYRTLKQGGYVYTIENEWTNIAEILELFKLMNMEPWTVFLEPQKSWHERFLDAGFEILYEDVVEYRKFNADDNELGEAAMKYGKDVGIKTTGYILRKNN